eukprot:6350931-Pyramimonas_sp.AAC.1
MVEALKKHWEPAFTASPVREDLIGPFLDRHMPEMDNALLQIRTIDNLRFVFKRAKDSAPGPDRPPARAWRGHPQLIM